MRDYTNAEIREAIGRARADGITLAAIWRATGVTENRLQGLLGPRNSIDHDASFEALCEWLVEKRFLPAKTPDTAQELQPVKKRKSPRQSMADELSVILDRLNNPDDFTDKEVDCDLYSFCRRYVERRDAQK